MSAPAGRLRVAQLVETLSAGGAENLAVTIAGALAVRGHQSHLIVLRGDGPLRHRVPGNVVVHDLACPPNTGGQVARIRRFLATSARVHATLKTARVEVLQTHLPLANFLGLAETWRRGCRSFATAHNNREFDYGDNAGAMRRALRRRGYRYIVRDCAGIIAVSDRVKTSLVDQLGLDTAGAARVSVVRNGVTVPPLPTTAEREAARQRWGVPPSAVLLLGVGRLTRQKNFAALVEALARLDAGEADWRCVIAGEGELRGELEQLVRNRTLAGRVALPGLVSGTGELMAAADVFCLPSSYEGLPLALLEAMARQLPVAAFAIDGVTDVVENGAQARLAPPEDIDGLACALRELIVAAPLREELGRAARERVRERFDFETTVDALEVIYRGNKGRTAGC